MGSDREHPGNDATPERMTWDATALPVSLGVCVAVGQ